MLALALPAGAVYAQADDDSRYTIMAPEPGRPNELPQPWLAPRYHSPRGTPQHVVIPRSQPIEPPRAAVPPPLIAPNGQPLPNLPIVAPSGPHGTETYQDRAARCAHQAGVYGAAAGDRAGYINSCINQ